MTIAVGDVEPVYARAVESGVAVVVPPHEFYGQRRLLVSDPYGHLVDVSNPTTAVTPRAQDLGDTR